MASTNSADIPTRATTAQLANRKIKATRERRPRGGSPNPSTLGQQQPANPLSSMNSNNNPASPAPAATNGFAFGQSQSFPQAAGTSGPATTQNGSQSFSFGGQNTSTQFGGGGSSSFNFSAPHSSGQQVSNPFSNAMGPAGASQGPGSQGFQGSIFNIPPAGGQGTQPGGATGGLFGTGTSQSQQPHPQNPFALGGGAASSGAPFSASPAPASGNIFGQSTGSNITGQPVSKPNIFGASQVSEPATNNKPLADAMQTSPDGPDRTSKPGMFYLSGSGQAPASPTLGVSSQPPKFTFGTTSQMGAPSFSAPSSQPSAAAVTSGGTSLFGAASKPDEAPKFGLRTATSGITASSAPAGTSLFGQSTKPDESTPSSAAATPTASSAPSIFTSAPAISAGGNTGTLFGASSKPQETAAAQASTPASTQPMFAATSGVAPSPNTSTLFGNLNQSKGTSTAPAAPLFAPTAPSQSPSPSLFGAPTQPATTGGSVFDRATKPQEAPPASTTSQTEAKSGFQPMTPMTGASSASVFNPPASAPSGQLFPPPASGSSLFDGPKPAAVTPTDNAPKEREAEAAPATKSLFGGISQNQSKPTEPTAFTPSKAPSIANNAPPALFSASTPQTQSSANPAGVGAQAEPAATTAAQKPKYVDQQTQTTFKAKSDWASVLPPSIPDDVTTEEERENYIRMWRLTMLNKSFQGQIAAVNPEKQDIDNIVAFYVMLRTQIGIPTELTTLLKPVRPATPDAFPPKDIPPLKRKADTTDDSATEKRRRPSQTETTTDVAATISQPKPAHLSSSSTKRKAPDDDEATADAQVGSAQAGKRTKVGEQVNGVSPSPRAETHDGQKNVVGLADEHEKGETADVPSGTQPAKPQVSDTLAKFASSFVAQKSQNDNAASPSDSSSESSDKVDDDDEIHGGSIDKADDKPNGTSSASSASPASDESRSLFNRVQVDEAGKPVRQVDSEQDASKEDSTQKEKESEPVPSLFAGSKFASSLSASGTTSPQFSFAGSSSASRTPSPAEKNGESTKPAYSTSIFAGLAPTSAPVNFSPSPATSPPPTSAPAVPTPSGIAGTTPNAPSPSPSIFGNTTSQAPTITFGASPSTSAPTPTPPNNTNTLFTTGIQQPKPLAPGQLGGASLSPFTQSAPSSTDASRSNTPAQSDTGADEPDEGAEQLPQTDLTRGGKGEEDEDTLFEARARGLKMQGGSWEAQGTGLLRILKHHTTGRARILLRTDPSGNVVLNSLLNSQIEYASNGKAVTFPVFARDSAPEKWAIRVKTEKSAEELATTMQNNKKTA